MSILNNEGHDQQGFMNQSSWAKVRKLEDEIARLRRYCSAAARDYAGALAVLEEAVGSELAEHFSRSAKELRETSEFMRLAAEGREDGTLYDDELSLATARAEAAEAERDALDISHKAIGKQLAEVGAERDRLRALIRVIDQRDCERNLFDCPSGGWIRQEINAALGIVPQQSTPPLVHVGADGAHEGPRAECDRCREWEAMHGSR